MLGVVNDVPVPKLVPPVAAAYQLMVPALGVAPKVTVPVPQRLAPVLDVMVGVAFGYRTGSRRTAIGRSKGKRGGTG